MKQLLTAFFLLSFLFGKTQTSCPPNIGFDNGDFSGWQCSTGTVASPTCSTNVVTLAPSLPTLNRHTIITPNSIIDPFGNFPLTPDNSNVVRLGFPGQTGSQVEGLSYTFSIPAASTDFTISFKFAVVYQEPSHCEKSQPHFSAKVYDVTAGAYINCSSAEYFGIVNQPGFQLSTNTSQGAVYYKPWSEVTLPLGAYAGHTLRLEFVNADCTFGGHWAYAYLDLPDNCNSIVKGNKFCPGTTATITGPGGYVGYTWWNSNFTQKIDTTKSITLNPAPTTPTLLALDLISPAGPACRDTVFVTVQPNPAVPANAGADQLRCNTNAVTIGTPATTGLGYSWTPATGLNFSNVAQPSASPTATTSYVVTATDSQTGCTKKDTVTVYVNSVPAVYNVNQTKQCLAGNNFIFTIATSFSGSSYTWDFGDGTTSVVQNPSHTYGTNGNYNVKLKVMAGGGCVDSSVQTVTVGPLTAPVATLNGNSLQSSYSSGNQWYLNGTAITGATSSSYVPMSSGNYTVMATVNGCSTTVSNTITYNITSLVELEREWMLRVLPNPVQSELFITHSGRDQLQLQVYDLGGRTMLIQPAIAATCKVDLSSYSAGSYIISLKNKRTGKEYRKLIVKN